MCLGELMERPEEARVDAINSNSDFDKGRSLGYYEAVTHLLNQAEVLGIINHLDKSIRDHPPLAF